MEPNAAPLGEARPPQTSDLVLQKQLRVSSFGAHVWGPEIPPTPQSEPLREFSVLRRDLEPGARGGGTRL